MDEWSGLGMAAGGGASAGGAVAMVLKHWLSKLSADNQDMRKDIDTLKTERVARLETAVASMSDVCAACKNGTRIDHVEPLLRRMNDKMDRVAEQVARMESSMDSLSSRAGRTSDSLVRHIENHAMEVKQSRRGGGE